MIMTSSSSSPEVESNIAATAVPHRGDRVRHDPLAVAGRRLAAPDLGEHPAAVAFHDAGVGRPGQTEQSQCSASASAITIL